MATGGFIKFSCPHCGRHLKVQDDGEGVETPCPSCDTTIRIPCLPVPIPYDQRPPGGEFVFAARCSDGAWRVLGWVADCVDAAQLSEILDKAYACFESIDPAQFDAGMRKEAEALRAAKRIEKLRLYDQLKAGVMGVVARTFRCPRYYRFGRSLRHEQDYVGMAMPLVADGFVGHFTGTVSEYRAQYFTEIMKVPFSESRKWLSAQQRDALRTIPEPTAPG